jgi:hypothetical protein
MLSSSDQPSVTSERLLAAGYQAVTDWPSMPEGYRWTEVAAVACDARDRVFVFNRGDRPVMIFDRDGTFVESWGDCVFVRPHGICVGSDGSVYCTDDLGHRVHKFTPDGRLLFTLGSGQPSNTGATCIDYRTIRRAAGPFNYPTNLALAPDGGLYIADGYGNARIHKFSPDGRLLFSWGEPGSGPGQFHVPHGVAVGRDETIFVADRENSRIQLFNAAGEYLGEWTDVARPCQVFIDRAERVYVAELGWRAGLWPGTRAPADEAPGGRVSVFDREGRLLGRWGGGLDPCAHGDFFAPHGICCDSQGSVYVAEVVASAGGNRGLVSLGCHSLQKFARRVKSSSG